MPMICRIWMNIEIKLPYRMNAPKIELRFATAGEWFALYMFLIACVSQAVIAEMSNTYAHEINRANMVLCMNQFTTIATNTPISAIAANWPIPERSFLVV